MLKYVQSDAIIAEVMDFLKSWFDANKVDESILYPRLRKTLSKLPGKAYPHKFAVIEVENGVGKLPKDFNRLKLALGCLPELVGSELERYEETINTEERHVCELNLCESSCDVCHDYNGNMYKIVQTFRRYPDTIQWTTFDFLKVGKSSKPVCDKDCFNFRSKSQNTVEVKNNLLHTSFDNGLVYIEYKALLEEECTFLIPENETIIDWIKADMIHTVFAALFYNGEPDIQGRLAKAEKDLFVAHQDARGIYNRKEFREYYSLANKLIDRYQVVERNVFDYKLYSLQNI